MLHVALVCPEVNGHLYPMTALGAELASRGHTVTLVAKPDGRSRADAAGIGFRAIGAEAFPAGAMAAFSAELGLRHGRDALRFTLRHFRDSARVILRDLPGVIREERIDGLLVDQTSSSAGSVAEALGLPFVTVANALAINTEPALPPAVTAWPYRDRWWARARNRLAYRVLKGWVRPIDETVNEYRKSHRLPPIRKLDDRYSRLAQIAQQPASFDFPRKRRPESFHYAGPFHRPGHDRDPVDFPWERLDGRPLVYASMGTLQNRLDWVFPLIAEACAPLDVQLVLSLGGSAAERPGELPGAPIVVDYAPQLKLVERAELVITHGGLNTTLETLACGVPLVAIPITNDQPGVAARLRWTGAGEFVTLKGLTAERLRRAVTAVRRTPAYREQAGRLQAEIASADGLAAAADIVESAFGAGGLAPEGRPPLNG